MSDSRAGRRWRTNAPGTGRSPLALIPGIWARVTRQFVGHIVEESQFVAHYKMNVAELRQTLGYGATEALRSCVEAIVTRRCEGGGEGGGSDSASGLRCHDGGATGEMP